MFTKKGLGPVVATALLLVVAVIGVVSFQSWYQGYSSSLFVQSETQSGDLTTGVERVVGESLFINAGKNLTVSSVKLDGNDCQITGSFSGMSRFNISECLSQATTPTPEIVVVTPDGIISEKIYIVEDTNAAVQQSFTTNPRADSQCYSASVNTLGTWEGCNNTLIVDRSMLMTAVDNNDSINDGSDYYIEYSGTNYTFGDSQYNIFTGQITNMSGLFEGTWSNRNKFNSNINYWDVSNVVDIESLFNYAESFNQSLNSWNTSNVVNMDLMFVGADSFNQPLNNWDVSNVVSMWGTFSSAPSFNQPLNNWDVRNVESMSEMFRSASSFNQDINDWNVSSVVNMYRMFSYLPSFNQPLNNWDVSNVNYMNNMFLSAESFNQPLDEWNTSNVVSMNQMFSRAHSFNQNISGWDVSNVTSMPWMFQHATSFNQPLDEWNVENVGDMREMFLNATSFNQNLSSWDVSSVTMCTDFDLDATSWVLSNSRPALDSGCLS